MFFNYIYDLNECCMDTFLYQVYPVSGPSGVLGN